MNPHRLLALLSIFSESDRRPYGLPAKLINKLIPITIVLHHIVDILIASAA